VRDEIFRSNPSAHSAQTERVIGRKPVWNRLLKRATHTICINKKRSQQQSIVLSKGSSNYILRMITTSCSSKIYRESIFQPFPRITTVMENNFDNSNIYLLTYTEGQSIIHIYKSTGYVIYFTLYSSAAELFISIQKPVGALAIVKRFYWSNFDP